MIQRVGGAHALGLSIGVIVGCVTILILIFSGRLIIGPAFAVDAIREARYDGPLCQDTGGGHFFKVGTSPFSRRLAGLCGSSLTRGVAAAAR